MIEGQQFGRDVKVLHDVIQGKPRLMCWTRDATGWLDTNYLVYPRLEQGNLMYDTLDRWNSPCLMPSEIWHNLGPHHAKIKTYLLLKGKP
jgi:hypothetical protein